MAASPMSPMKLKAMSYLVQRKVKSRSNHAPMLLTVIEIIAMMSIENTILAAG